MATEVAQITARDRTGIVTYLRKHHEVIAQLQEYPIALERLASVPMTVLPVDEALLRTASAIAMQHRLLTNDAMIVALMRREQLTHLVTNDEDFNRVTDLTVWMPG
jgi:predicted nucleic acid-binding protein